MTVPDQLGDPVDGDTVAARRKQDLEQLLRTYSTEIARAEYALAIHDLERAKDPDDRARTAGVVFERLHVESQHLNCLGSSAVVTHGSGAGQV